MYFFIDEANPKEHTLMISCWQRSLYHSSICESLLALSVSAYHAMLNNPQIFFEEKRQTTP